MKIKLLISTLIKYFMGLLLVAALLFVPAGTLNYSGGWLLIGLLFGPMLILGAVMLVKAPELLEKRLNTKEKEDAQKSVVALSALIFLVGFILSALDFRLGWFQLPKPIVIIGAVVLVVSYGLYAEVMRENAYLSRTIEIQKGQKVVDKGLYGIVRHPMYSVTITLFLSFPMVLGSGAGLIVFLVYPLLIVKRIKNEEKVLAEGLEGYTEYMRKVRWRIVPFVW